MCDLVEDIKAYANKFNQSYSRRHYKMKDANKHACEDGTYN